MLIKHISQNNGVFVQVDADCDGYTSAAILINYLNCLFPHFVQTKLQFRVHDEKTHGIILETIPDDVKLVIAPDSSSSSFEEHKALNEKGIDVLVIDHHEAEKLSEFACVINNQFGDYETKSLSGAGVVYKFCQYLDSIMDTDYAKDYADLASVGIIADVMDLSAPEIRKIIKDGTSILKNPLIKSMVDKDNFHFGGKSVTSTGIAWFIAPYINAISRSGKIDERIVVFEAMLEHLAYQTIPSTKRGCSGQMETRVEQAIRTCTNVKNRQDKTKVEMTEIVSKIIEEQKLDENKVIAVRLEPKYAADKNLTGLIANSLVEVYNRPILILNQYKEDNKIIWMGSGRGYEDGGLGSFRQLLLDSNLVNFAEGHANAFGVSINEENYDKLIDYINEAYKNFNCEPVYKVDFIWDGNSEINEFKLAEIANEEALWGKGIDEPLVAIENFKIYGNKLNLYGLDKGKPVLNIGLEDGSSLVKFKSSEEEFSNLYSELGYVIINAVGTCQKSSWGIPQFKIKDYQIMGRTEYYF